MDLQQEKPEKAQIVMEWERIGQSLFRFLVGLGFIFGWLFLLLVTLALLGAALFAMSKLSFAWLLVTAGMIPVGLFIWWLSFHVAVDTMADLGIRLKGAWSWIALPVAPLLALVSFGIAFFAGFGNFVMKPGFLALCVGIGGLVLVSLALLVLALAC